jgi:hypothetical protein
MMMKKQIRFMVDIPFLRNEDEIEERICANPDCTKRGDFKAPRSSYDLRDYIWFCLDHVKEYNRSWNYFDGLDEISVEETIRRDTTWERPSWRFGTPPRYARWHDHLDDPLGALNDDRGGNSSSSTAPPQPLSADEKKAWNIIGLSPCSDEQRVKKRYKELVKTHHPDANGGSRKAEDQLKTINWAYAILKQCFNNDLP